MNMKLEDLVGNNFYSIVAEEVIKYGGSDPGDDKFIMRPVVDFVFKLLFGDAKRTERLESLLSSILKLPKEEFENITIINPELQKEFINDKYGILDIRASLKDGKQINIEIQVLPFPLMPERTLYYWAKLYTQQMKAGDNYKELKKCITINILDYDFPLATKVHSMYSLREEKTGERLTDKEEIHFLDLEKLRKGMGIDGLDASLLKWLRFLASSSKGELEMLARNNKEIKTAYEYLQEISANDKKRMEYEAREKWLMDQRTREVLAREEGMEKGRAEGLLEVAENALEQGMDITLIEKLTGLSNAEIEKLKRSE